MSQEPKIPSIISYSPDKNNCQIRSPKFKRIRNPTVRTTKRQSSLESKSTKISRLKLKSWIQPQNQSMRHLHSWTLLPTHHYYKSRDSRIHSNMLKLKLDPDPRWPQWSRHSSLWLPIRTSAIRILLERSSMLLMISETQLLIHSMTSLHKKQIMSLHMGNTLNNWMKSMLNSKSKSITLIST